MHRFFSCTKSFILQAIILKKNKSLAPLIIAGANRDWLQLRLRAQFLFYPVNQVV